MNKKVFIGWNGENLDIAKKVGNIIKKHGFIPTVGGGSSSRRFVGETVIDQMNQSEIAIIIIERVYLEKNAFKLSENVMYEWGYLNSKINDPEKIRIFLINTNIDDLPSDVKGYWVCKINKNAYSNYEEKEKSFNKVAEDISSVFLEDISKIKQPNKDKLQYLVHWDEYKHEIYNYNGYSQISEKLLYGMQGAVYSNETEYLKESLDEMKCDSEELRAIKNCVCSMLSVFNLTNRLTRNLTRGEYGELVDSLSVEYETEIEDADLRAWCEILRKDKLQLCYEFGAYSFENSALYLKQSLKQGLEVVELINKQISHKPTDKYYALLYLSFQYRNLSELYHLLNDFSPKEYTVNDEIYYRKLTCDKRNELRRYYKQTYGDDMVFDSLLQEYILSLIEYYPFVNDIDKKEGMYNTIQTSVEKLRLQIERKNYVFNEISDKAALMMNLGEI